MNSWFERRRRAALLAAALRQILRDADDLDGIARAIARSKFAAVLEGSARDLRDRVAELIDELRVDLEPAASGFDPDQVAYGRPAPPERIALLVSHYHQEDSYDA